MDNFDEYVNYYMDWHEFYNIEGDPNLFYDNQLMGSNLTWQLYNQKETHVNDSSEDNELATHDDKLKIPANQLLLKGIITETESTIRVTNQFTNLNMGGLTTNASKLVNTANEYSDLVSGFSGLSDSILDTGGRLSDKLNELLEGSFIQDIINIGSRQRHFYIATDHVKSFKGSSLDVSLPTLKTTIYHGQTGTDKPEPVTNRILFLTNIFMGGLASIESELNIGEAGSMGGMIKAPNQFETNFDVFGDTTGNMVGAFKLKYGRAEYVNLLVNSFDVVLSNYNALDKNGNDSGYPLYAKLTLTLEPASFYTRGNFKHILKNWNNQLHY